MTTEPTTQHRRPRGVYLLPNLFTTAALFCGFYAIIAALQGRFEPAAIAVFVAMVLDGLDGRVARLTHTESEFGAEYDSMADLVSFGLAPALIMYEWSLGATVSMGPFLSKLGWLAAFFYRLAGGVFLHGDGGHASGPVQRPARQHRQALFHRLAQPVGGRHRQRHGLLELI